MDETRALINIADSDALREFEQALSEKHKSVSDETTPPPHIGSRPDGYDYVNEGYMRSKLNEKYPIWSWKPAGSEPVQFLGSEWVTVSGELEIYDNGVKRSFFSPGAARVQFQRGKEHTAAYVVDIDKNLASANTNAFKRAVNRLTNIADDVYHKQVEDIMLAPEEIETLEEAIADMTNEEKENIREKAETGEINKRNFKRVMTRLEVLNTEQTKENNTNE